jgi:hypothetical protein
MAAEVNILSKTLSLRLSFPEPENVNPVEMLDFSS